MPDYLPLCAFRQALLPDACGSCAWWQTTANERLSPEDAAERRKQWAATVETSWGTWGLILEDDGTPPTGRDRAPVAVGSISFAPAPMVPRLRGLPFHSLAAGSALLFCPWLDDDQPRAQAKRLLQKSLGHLKSRGMAEAFAVADGVGSADAVGWGAGARPGSCGREDGRAGARDGGCACGLFSVDFLASCGFEPVMETGGLVLMRADLRGLLSLIGQVETALRRVIRHEPTPSPATWTHRGA